MKWLLSYSLFLIIACCVGIKRCCAWRGAGADSVSYGTECVFFILIEKGRFIVLDLWGVRIDNLCGTSWTCILLDR